MVVEELKWKSFIRFLTLVTHLGPLFIDSSIFKYGFRVWVLACAEFSRAYCSSTAESLKLRSQNNKNSFPNDSNSFGSMIYRYRYVQQYFKWSEYISGGPRPAVSMIDGLIEPT